MKPYEALKDKLAYFGGYKWLPYVDAVGLVEENEKLKEKISMNERMQKFTNAHIKEQSKKVKHLFPLENTAGYGQLCDKLLQYEKVLKDIIKTYEYGQPDNNGEVMVEVEDTCDAMYQTAIKALKHD